MSFAMKLMAVLLAVGNAATALPYENSVVSIGGREFLIEGLEPIVDDLSTTLPLIFAPSLGEFLRADELLGDHGVSIIQTGDLASNILTIGMSKAELSEPSLYLEGYHMRQSGQLHISKGSVYYIPKQSDVEYSVTCSYDKSLDRIGRCDVNVAYPYASHLMLQAREFYPGPLDEISPYFKDIAERLIEIMVCLDVTEKGLEEDSGTFGEILQVHPDLSGCEIELTS